MPGGSFSRNRDAALAQKYCGSDGRYRVNITEPIEGSKLLNDLIQKLVRHEEFVSAPQRRKVFLHPKSLGASIAGHKRQVSSCDDCHGCESWSVAERPTLTEEQPPSH
jgi:hypothetical protein